MDMRSPLSRARGLGSTGEGAAHWVAERLSAIALIPLSLWFIFSALSLIGADFQTFALWIGEHGNALLLILLIIALFHHAMLGLHVVIEDYVHHETAKTIGVLLVRFVFVACAVSSVLSVLMLAAGV
jgi:succinate dehydrogenase / fumarate reductase membrane anchor subunit